MFTSSGLCYISHWCAFLDELHYLSYWCGLKTPLRLEWSGASLEWSTASIVKRPKHQPASIGAEVVSVHHQQDHSFTGGVLLMIISTCCLFRLHNSMWDWLSWWILRVAVERCKWWRILRWHRLCDLNEVYSEDVEMWWATLKIQPLGLIPNVVNISI